MKSILTRGFLLSLVLLSFFKSSFSQCGAPLAATGNNYTTGAASVNLNTYYVGTGNPVKGDTRLDVTNGSRRGVAVNLAAGDMVLIIQMQGAEFNTSNSDSYGDGVAGGDASGFLNTNLVAGAYEYNIVTSYNTGSGRINFTYALANNYYTRAFSTTGKQAYQVIKVARYYNITIANNQTITGLPWDGSTGGVVAIEATNTLTFSGSGSTIHANALGFRGGGGKYRNGAKTNNSSTSSGVTALTNTDYRWLSPFSLWANQTGGAKGEGVAGTPVYYHIEGSNDSATGTSEGYLSGSIGRGAPGNAGGGGTDGDVGVNQYNTGGGGGGNGGAGGKGGSGWDSGPGDPSTYNTGGFGGGAYPNPNTGRIIMGGGGGAGTGNNASLGVSDYLCSGAAGGGIVLVRARTFVAASGGSITANGAASYDITTAGVTDAAGGGGAGGTIIVLTNTSTPSTNANLVATANGGKGGNSTVHYAHGPGGGGGGGVVITNVLANANITVNGGLNGLTRTGSTSGAIDNTYNATSGTGGVKNVLTTTPLLVSPGNAASQCGILPVTLTAWTGVYRNEKTFLNWQTDRGIDFSHFVIERSADGVHYASLGQIQASTAAALTLQYAFTDIAPAAGANYYRLKMVDNNGTYQYSGIITIRTNVQGFNVIASPNPFTDNVTITIESKTDETVYLRVFNNDGRLLWSKTTSVTAGTNVQYFNELQSLPKGMYIIKVNKQNTETSLKLVKQ